MFKVSYIGSCGKLAIPWQPSFLTNQIILALFVEGIPVIISTKLF